ncbi:MAG: IS3 family transposase [Ruminococcus flavefaciens]|nr:IS3 family transposase [Ruminococcus flavefaciens]
MNKTFDSLDQLQSELADSVNWFNNSRIHGSLGYLSPLPFKSSHSAK